MAAGNNPNFAAMANGLSGANAPRDAYPVLPKPVGYADNASVRTIVNGVPVKVRVFVSLVNEWRVVIVVKRNVRPPVTGRQNVSGSKRSKNVIIAAGNGATRSGSGTHAIAQSRETSTTTVT